MAALAAATERVTIGPLVACLGFHPPATVAKMAATIDEVSGGRFTLGVGAGWNEREFHAFGIPYDHRVSRFAEAFEIVRRLLDGERTTLDGRHWQADDAVLLPPPQRRIPDGRVQRAAHAGSHAAVGRAWNTWWEDYGNTAEAFASTRASPRRRPTPRPGAIRRSACALVALDAPRERPRPPPRPADRSRPGRPALLGSRTRRGRGDPRPVTDHRGVDPRRRRG